MKFSIQIVFEGSIVSPKTAARLPRVLPNRINGRLLSRCRKRLYARLRDEAKTKEQEERLLKVMQGRVEDAAKMLDDIIDNVVCEILSVQAMSYIYEELPESTEEQIIRKIVKSFLHQLDQNFLASLERFENEAKDMGNKDVAILISKIGKEVLQQVQDQFPPEVLLLEDLMKISDKKARIAKIYSVYETEKETKNEESPTKANTLEEDDLQLDLEELEDTPIEDIDLKAELRRLKVLKDEKGLKLLKEELEKPQVIEPINSETTADFDDVLDSMGDSALDDCIPDKSDNDTEERIKYGKRIDPVQLFMAANQFISDIEEKEEIANRELLAKLCVIREEARLIELEMKFQGVQLQDNPIKLRENVPSQVMGIIQQCIKTSDSIKRVGLIRKVFEKDCYGPSQKDTNRAPGYVRPGIFMTALTMTQMEADAKSKAETTASQYTPQFLQKIEDTRLEALLVLRDMAWGQFSSEELAKRQKERQETEMKNNKSEETQKVDYK